MKKVSFPTGMTIETWLPPEDSEKLIEALRKGQKPNHCCMVISDDSICPRYIDFYVNGKRIIRKIN